MTTTRFYLEILEPPRYEGAAERWFRPRGEGFDTLGEAQEYCAEKMFDDVECRYVRETTEVVVVDAPAIPGWVIAVFEGDADDTDTYGPYVGTYDEVRTIADEWAVPENGKVEVLELQPKR